MGNRKDISLKRFADSEAVTFIHILKILNQVVGKEEKILELKVRRAGTLINDLVEAQIRAERAYDQVNSEESVIMDRELRIKDET